MVVIPSFSPGKFESGRTREGSQEIRVIKHTLFNYNVMHIRLYCVYKLIYIYIYIYMYIYIYIYIYIVSV